MQLESIFCAISTDGTFWLLNWVVLPKSRTVYQYTELLSCRGLYWLPSHRLPSRKGNKSLTKGLLFSVLIILSFPTRTVHTESICHAFVVSVVR